MSNTTNVNEKMTIEEQNMFVELGKIHAMKEAKEAKKKANVNEIETLFYKYIPREQTVKFIKNVTANELMDIKREFGLNCENRGITFGGDEVEDVEPFRKFLVKVFWYINHKNNEITDLRKKLKIEEDRGNDLDENSKEMINELEQLEKDFNLYKKNNDFYKTYYRIFLFFTCIFVFQNYSEIFIFLAIIVDVMASIIRTTTFHQVHDAYIYLTIFCFFLITIYSMFFSNFEKEKEE